MIRFSLVACALLFAPLGISHAQACEPAEMATTEDGFAFKVVPGSDKISVFEGETGDVEVFTMELMQPYFVICEAVDRYRITEIPAQTVAEAINARNGYVPKAQVNLWPTREALSFSEIAFLDKRPEIVAWDDENVLDKYMETLNDRLHKPAFKENLESTLKRGRSTRPYPVLGSELKKLKGIAEKRVFNVLLPAALPAEARIVIEKEDVGKTGALSAASILVVFDATASMEDFALEAAKAISGAAAGLPSDVRDKSQMGILFYRDETDPERLVSIPPIPLTEAADALKEASKYMSGGGDEPEPVLDATYFGTHMYKWGQAAGNKIMIVVLNEDAKEKTIGTLNEDGSIPAGQDVISISKALFDQAIPVITVQAGPNTGPNLQPVLQTLADQTSGTFVEWEAGSTEAKVAAALADLMSATTTDASRSGTEALSKMEFDYRGYATIPLDVLDGKKMEILRDAGVDFNIDPGEGGVLVREGYILENKDLLSPEIQIEKETLQHLINLYTVLGTTGVDVDTMLRSASEAIAAIAGENYDDSESINEILRKQAGIQFRSKLLEFNLEWLGALTQAERLDFAARLQDAGNILTQHLEANLAEFDTNPAVWMPISVLP